MTITKNNQRGKISYGENVGPHKMKANRNQVKDLGMERSQKLRNYFTLSALFVCVFVVTNIETCSRHTSPPPELPLSELVPCLHATAPMSTPLLEFPFPQGVFRHHVRPELLSARHLSLDSECGY